LVDDVLFTGDILAGDEELNNAPISYAYSITQRLASLARLRDIRCSRYVLGHGHVEEEIASLIDRNLAHIERVLDLITALVTGSPLDTTTLLDSVVDRLRIQIRNVRDYYTIYPALHAYISHLSNQGRIAPAIQSNRLLWCKPGGS
jgi:glyoxylase-like metal-dependent hydrolase (beta-lactamase superfamily II)